mgnify:CR=1 FL=1
MLVRKKKRVFPFRKIPVLGCVGFCFKMSDFSILEFSGFILLVTYFNSLFMSNMSPIAPFFVMDFACVPLVSFGFSFLVVVEIGSLPDQYIVLFHIGIVRHFQTVYPTGNTSSQTPSRVITVFLFCYCLKCLLWIPIVERKMTWLEMGVDVLI